MSRPATGRGSSAVWWDVPGPGAWADRAACSRTPDLADLFTDPQSPRDVAEAAQLCAACPVRQQCGDYGREIAADGVWGGWFLRHGRPRTAPALSA